MKTNKTIRNGLQKTIAWMLGGMMTLSSFTGFAASSTPAYDKGNAPFGTNGHSEFAWYVQPTAIEDVYKVSLSMDVYVEPKPAEIVLVLDNSGSMGRPYELSYGIWDGSEQFSYPVPEESYTRLISGVPTVQKKEATASTYDTVPSIYAGGTYEFPINSLAYLFPDTYSPNFWYLNPLGAYKYGNEGAWLQDQNEKEITPPLGANPKITTPHNKEYVTQKYRLEWVREATMDVLDELLTEESNPLNFDQLKIAIVAFGGASTDVSSTINPFYAVPDTSGGWWYEGGGGTYNGESGVGGGGPLYPNGPNTPISNQNAAITYSSGWITNKNKDAKSDEFFHSYIRRIENTFVSAGLEEAMDQFAALASEEWAPDNRHVFLLADGGDNSTANLMVPSDKKFFRTSQIVTNNQVDPTRTLAAAAYLKNPNNYGATFTTVGVLDNEEHNASLISNTAYWNVSDWTTFTSLGLSASRESAAYPETNLILLSTPMTASAKQFATGSGYYGSGINATGGTQGLLNADTFANHMNYSGSNTRFTQNPHQSIPVGSTEPGNGYEEFTKDIIANRKAGYAGENYYYAKDETEVKAAFQAFAAKFMNSAKDVRIEQTLTSHFDFYKMPNEPLYVTSDGSTAKLSGKNLNWDISSLSAKGGTVTLSYYVKFDRTGTDPSMSYPIANFTNVYWKALGSIESSSQFPIPYISGTSNVDGWKGSTGNVMTPVENGKSGTGTISADGAPSFVGNGDISLSNTTSDKSSSNIGAMGPALQTYTASVANPNVGKKKTTKTTAQSTEEKLDETEFAKIKGKSLQVNVAKANVYEKPDETSKVLLYLTKGKQFKISGATKKFYQIRYKTKDGKVTTGYVKKTDVKVIS